MTTEFIKYVADIALKNALFEYNNSETRLRFKWLVEDMLAPYKRHINPALEFKVICDETNNPLAIVNANEFCADIYYKTDDEPFIWLEIRVNNQSEDLTEISEYYLLSSPDFY